MEALVSTLRSILAKHPEVGLAILFGSAARGKLRPRSDLDLAVRLAPSKQSADLSALADEVARATRREVDVVDLSQLGSSLLRLEISKGILVAGAQEVWIEFRREAFREWRDFGPRHRRMTDPAIKKLIRSSGSSS